MQNQLYPTIAISFVLALTAGCSSMSDVVETPQAQETAPEIIADQEPAQIETNPEIALETTFYFDFDDATLRPNVRQAIEAHAERLKTDSQVIRIEGYADERGTEAYNKELGQRRADAVRDLLISMGVRSSQIQTVSFGEKKALSLGSGETVWQKNRRVELK